MEDLAEVPGHLLRFHIERTRAFMERAEEQRRADDAEWTVPTEKRDRDPDESVLRGEPHLKLTGGAENFVNPDHPGHGAGQGHRDHPNSGRVDADGSRGLFVISHCPNFITERRAPKE